MKLNNKGMTLVELIISVALISVVVGFLFKILLDVKYEKDNVGYAANNQTNRAELINMIQSAILENGLIEVTYNVEEENEIKLEHNYGYITLNISNDRKTLTYQEENRSWTIEDAGYTFGGIDVTIIDDKYVKIIIEVKNPLNDSKLIDDIELLLKYKKIEKEPLINHIMRDNNISLTSPDFNRKTNAGEYGFYKADDDLGVSYYFRGDVSNNYVQLGTYPKDTVLTLQSERKEIAAGTPMYWRIVRINGDGTFRLIYDGTALSANGTAKLYAMIGQKPFNADNVGDTYDFSSAKYVGYTYDASDTDKTQIDSTIKSEVDKWYEDNVLKNFDNYLADGIFCNDRKVYQENAYRYYYNPHLRLFNNTPSLKCENKSDRYTVDDTIGNGLLDYPIGLITVDEVLMAGSGKGTGNTDMETNYLYIDYHYWTISPETYLGNNHFGARPYFFSSTSGTIGLYPQDASLERGIRPVINVKADVLVYRGDGTINDPYVLTY